MHTVAIILVNWNGKDDTIECVASLRRLSAPKSTNIRIVVVDNHSSDDSVSALTRAYPDIDIVPLDENTGFTGGNNAGMKHALECGATHMWLLNNDTTVDTHALRELHARHQRQNGGLVGSKIYFSPGHEFHADRYKKAERGKVIWYAGGVIDWDNIYASHRGVDEVDIGQYDESQETQFVTGCSMFFSRETIDQIGLFDERYFLYLEDVEYSVRAKRNGLPVSYEPASIVWHKNAGSSDMPGSDLQQYYMSRNRLLFGFTYARGRAKFALLRQAIRMIARPDNAVQKQAVIDAFLARYGRQSRWQKQ